MFFINTALGIKLITRTDDTNTPDFLFGMLIIGVAVVELCFHAISQRQAPLIRFPRPFTPDLFFIRFLQYGGWGIVVIGFASAVIGLTDTALIIDCVVVALVIILRVGVALYADFNACRRWKPKDGILILYVSDTIWLVMTFVCGCIGLIQALRSPSPVIHSLWAPIIFVMIVDECGQIFYVYGVGVLLGRQHWRTGANQMIMSCLPLLSYVMPIATMIMFFANGEDATPMLPYIIGVISFTWIRQMLIIWYAFLSSAYERHRVQPPPPVLTEVIIWEDK